MRCAKRIIPVLIICLLLPVLHFAAEGTECVNAGLAMDTEIPVITIEKQKIEMKKTPGLVNAPEEYASVKPETVDAVYSYVYPYEAFYDSKWFTGTAVEIPFYEYSRGSAKGSDYERIYIYMFNSSGTMVAAYEGSFEKEEGWYAWTIKIEGSEKWARTKHYLVYYSTYHEGNKNSEPIPISILWDDYKNKGNTAAVDPNLLSRHFDCGVLESVTFTVTSLGYGGQTYYFELCDANYKILYKQTGPIDLKQGTYTYEVKLKEHLRPGIYYIRAFGSRQSHVNETNKYGKFYVDHTGFGWQVDKTSGTLYLFGGGKMPVFSIYENRPWEADGVREERDIYNVVIEPGFTTVSHDLCYGFSNLKSVTLPDGLVSIEYYAFYETKLESVAIPNSVSTIGFGAFARCPKLKTVTTFGNWKKPPETAKGIQSSAFWATGLTSMQIPASIMRIEKEAFLDCKRLDEIYFQDEPPAIDAAAFVDVIAWGYYPSHLSGWSEDKLQHYGGDLLWKPYERPLEKVIMTKSLAHRTGNIIYWNAARHADLYQVFRRAENEDNWTLLTNTRSLGYKDESAKRGVKYYYKVRSRNGDKMSSLDIPALSATRAFELKEPFVCDCDAYTDGIEIEWSYVQGAAFYQVFRRQEGETSWTLVVNTEKERYRDKTVEPEIQYHYCVRARDGDGMSDMSNSVSAKAECPLGYASMSKAVGHADGITVYWGLNAKAEDYEVFRRTDDETSWTSIGRSEELSFTDTTAKFGAEYFYKVRAWNGDLFSSMSTNAVSAIRPYPLASVKMTKALGHATGNILYWEAVENAKFYQVYRRADSENGWTLLKNTGSLAYKDESAVVGVKYYYRVRARNGELMSDLNITALSAVRPYPLASVKMTKAIGHATGNIIYWEAVENAKFYQVYRRAADENGWTLIKNTGSLAYKDTEAQSGVKYYYKVVARNADQRSSMDIASVSAIRP